MNGWSPLLQTLLRMPIRCLEDMQICRDIFSATIQPAQILRRDQAFADSLQEIITQLAPDQIIPTGVVCSSGWTTGLPRIHITAILCNYSGSFLMLKITPWDTPDMAKAAKKTLELRGNGETGWSRAWKISFRGRLGFGDHAFKRLQRLLTPLTNLDLKMKGDARTYPNLFDAHPAFQIDGYFLEQLRALQNCNCKVMAMAM